MSTDTALTQNTFDVTRIAYIVPHAVNDGYESDICLMPEGEGKPFEFIPCSLSTKDAAEHFNDVGEGAVNLIHLKDCGTTINSRTVAQLHLTPNAITNAFIGWKAGKAAVGVPVRANPNQIRDIETDINISRLRAVAEQNVLGRGHQRDFRLSRA